MAIFLHGLPDILLYRPSITASKKPVSVIFLLNTNTKYLLIVPAWSLTYELYFYTLISILLACQKNKLSIILVILLGMIICKHLLVESGTNKLLDFFFSALLSELILGYLMFTFLGKLSAKIMIPLSFIACITFLSLAVYLNIGYGWIRVMTFGIFAFFLILASVLIENYGVIFTNGLLKIMGDASYTIYLSHTILLDLFYATGLRDCLAATHFPLLGFALTLIAIIGFSVLFYKYIELPLYNRVKAVYLSPGYK